MCRSVPPAGKVLNEAPLVSEVVHPKAVLGYRGEVQLLWL